MRAIALLVLSATVFASSPATPPPYEEQVRQCALIADVRLVELSGEAGETIAVELVEVHKGALEQGSKVHVSPGDDPARSWAFSHAHPGDSYLLYLRAPVRETNGAYRTYYAFDLAEPHDVVAPWEEEDPSDARIASLRARRNEVIRFLAGLESLDGDPVAAGARWIRGLGHSNRDLVRTMMYRIRIGEIGEPSKGFLRLVTRQRDRARLSLALEALGLVASPEPGIRLEALAALRTLAQAYPGVLPRDESVRVARSALDEDDPVLSRAGLRLLAALNHRRALEAATEWLRDRRDEDDLRAALEAIATLGETRGIGIESALPAIRELYASRRGDAVEGAVRWMLVGLFGNRDYDRERWLAWLGKRGPR